MSNYWVVCDYKKENTESYQGVFIAEVNKNTMDQVLSRSTGDFVKDFNDLIQDYIEKYTKKPFITDSVYEYIQNFNDQHNDKIRFTVKEPEKYSNIMPTVKWEKENPISKSIRETKERDYEIFTKLAEAREE